MSIRGVEKYGDSVNYLHCIRRNLDLIAKSLWDQLGRAFSSLEVKPSENDLVDHLRLISEVKKEGKFLAKAKFLNKFLKRKPGKRKLSKRDV